MSSLDVFKVLEHLEFLLHKVDEPLVLQRLRLNKLELPQHLRTQSSAIATCEQADFVSLSFNFSP